MPPFLKRLALWKTNQKSYSEGGWTLAHRALDRDGTFDRPSPIILEMGFLGKPIADVVGPTPFTAWQAAFDPLLREVEK